jgi:hypothetical protein
MRLISNIAPPSTSPWKSRNPPKWGPRCHPRTRTALAVFLDCDGLLLPELCGLVASRCRPWGSLGFEPVVNNRSCCSPDPPPSADPSERFPPLRPNPVTPTWLPCLPKPEPLSSLPTASHPKTTCRRRDLRGLTLTESVASRTCCHTRSARCSHGLPRLLALAHAQELPPVRCTPPKWSATRDASTASDATAFPPFRLRETTVTVETSASFRTAVSPCSKLPSNPPGHRSNRTLSGSGRNQNPSCLRRTATRTNLSAFLYAEATSLVTEVGPNPPTMCFHLMPACCHK